MNEQDLIANDAKIAVLAEQEIIGALLLDNDSIDRIHDLEPAHFYRADNRAIFSEIRRQIGLGNRVDPLSLLEPLRGQVEDCFRYLTTLRNNCGSAVTIRRHADMVLDKAMKRGMAAIGRDLEAMAWGSPTPAEEAIAGASARLDELVKRKGQSDPRLLSDTLAGYMDVLTSRMNGENKPIALGFTDLDRKLSGGLERGTLTVIAGRPAMGKCLGKGTGVVMFDGTIKNVEDIIPGDILMGDDSTPRNVLSIARGKEQMYWVRQGKGIDYRVNESHILSLKYSRNESGRKNGDILNISVRDYLAKSNKFKNNCKGYKVNIEFPEIPLPVDPYFLGLWLGDGDTNTTRITNIDKEILEWLTYYANSIGMKAYIKDYGSRATCIAITTGILGGNYKKRKNHLMNSLRDLDVIGNKHIPHIYLSNSTDNRLKLLAGLIDSDGHSAGGRGYEITQTNEKLAIQIKFLCDSLGFKTSITKKKTSFKNSIYDYSGVAYRVRFYGDLHKIPVIVERKKIPISTRRTNWKVTGIKIEADCIDDFYGFEIDGNHLFLLSDMTVTHNTAMALALARNVAETGVALFLSMEMSSVQVNDRNIGALGHIPVPWLRDPPEHAPPGSQSEIYWSAMTVALSRAQQLRLFIDDQTGLNLLQVRSKSRKVKRTAGALDVIVLDQLSFLTGAQSEKSYEQVGEYTRGLIALAKELDCAVVLLCQLNRKCEDRNDKRPMASDLAQSGSIEQDAANILLLYRDEVYNPASEDRGICEVIIAKQRQGQPGTVGLAYIGEQTRFENLAHHWIPPNERPRDEPVSRPRRGFS